MKTLFTWKRPQILKIGSLLISFSLIPTTVHSLQGRITESKYGVGVDSVKVSLKGTSTFVYTDSLGRYSISGTGIGQKGKISLSTYWDEKTGNVFWDPSVKNVRIRINDMQGKLLQDFRPQSSLGKYQFPIEQLNQGIYSLRVQTDKTELLIRTFLFNGKIKNSVTSRPAQKLALGLAKSAAPGVTLTMEKKGWITRDSLVDNTPLEMNIPLKRQKIKVLIVDGFSNHNWQQTTKVIKAILALPEFFQVDVTTSPAEPESSPLYDAWNPDFKAYDVVVMNIANIFTQIRWPARIKTAFENYVAEGGGVYMFHAAACNFSDWPEFMKMVGFTWESSSFGPSNEMVNGVPVEIPTGSGPGTSHGDRSDAVLEINTSHPINKGMPGKWRTTDTEVYTYARTLPNIWKNVTPMAWSSDNTNGTGKVWPVQILTKYGKGYGYTSLLGHLWGGEIYPDRMADIGLHTTLIRAIEWMGRHEIMYPIPKNFPTELSTSKDTSLHF